MAWSVEISRQARKDLDALDPQQARRLLSFLADRIRGAQDPRRHGEVLQGRLGSLWRYRVGDCRLICDLQGDRLVVLVVRVGHRREVYRG